MPRWLQIVLHIATIGAGSYVSFATGTPLPLVISSGLNGVIGTVGQSYNTDGTPQSIPFKPQESLTNVKNPD